MEQDANNLKRAVNESLLRIKQERADSEHDSFFECDDDTLSTYADTYSQSILPQRFFEELDNALHGLSREEYIREILRQCKTEYIKLDEYRHRLAERARSNPECPRTRLVNRRNSAHAPREKKCATDCYILSAFIQGENTKEIADIFSSASTGLNETIVIDQDTTAENATIHQPEVFAMLSNIQSEVQRISREQLKTAAKLNEIHCDVEQMANNYRVMHGTLRSVLARLPPTTGDSEIEKLKGDVQRLGSSIAVVNKKLLDNEIQGHHDDNACTIPETDVNHTSTTMSYADVLKSPPTNERFSPSQETAHSYPEARTVHPPTASPGHTPERNENSHVTVDTDRPEDHTNSPEHCEYQSQPFEAKFVSARKRRNVSYYVSNIDCDVSESDIYNYFKDNHVHVTYVRLYRGATGSSAKVNVPEELEPIIDDYAFWPEGIAYRKWVPQDEYQQTRRQQRVRRHPRNDRNGFSNRYNNDRRRSDYWGRDASYNYHRNRDYDHRESAHASGRYDSGYHRNKKHGDRYADTHDWGRDRDLESQDHTDWIGYTDGCD